MSNKGNWVWAKRPMKYAGVRYERGEVFRLQRGARNNEKLLAYGYLSEDVPPREEQYELEGTGRFFVGMAERAYAGDKAARQMRISNNPFEQDRQAAREEALLNNVAPVTVD